MYKSNLRTVIIVIVVCLLASCASVEVKPRCWQNAYYQAVVVETELGLPTRIVVARNRATEGGHAQAQAYVDGKWQWLSLSQRPTIVIENRKDRAWGKINKPAQFYTKEQVVNMWGK
jgi:hypothetical protein